MHTHLQKELSERLSNTLLFVAFQLSLQAQELNLKKLCECLGIMLFANETRLIIGCPKNCIGIASYASSTLDLDC